MVTSCCLTRSVRTSQALNCYRSIRKLLSLERRRRHPSSDQLMQVGSRSSKTVLEYYRELGLVMWDKVGMARNEKGLKEAISKIDGLSDLWSNVRITGEAKAHNKTLELAGRVADLLELGQLMARDALERAESCGGHFREESATLPRAKRCETTSNGHAAVWEWQGQGQTQKLHKEKLDFEVVHLAQRSYK